jgi:DNA-binding CsgD family transcriptional regulator
MSGPVLPLRGRERERALLDDFVTDVQSGRSRAVVICGAPGIGKSRLLDEGVSLARTLGTRVAVARADELYTVAPLALLLSALTSGTPPVLDREEVRALERPGDQRFWLLEDLAEVLERVCAATPVVVALDDVQWADDATLWAIGVLAQRLRTLPFGWLLSTRSRGVKPTALRLVEELDARGALRIDLTPLATDALETLAVDMLGATPDPRLNDSLAQAGGNPFIAIELLRALVAEQLVQIADGVASPVATRAPEQFRARIQTRLRTLSPRARDLVQGGAVLGRAFRLNDVAQVIGVSPPELVSPLAEVFALDVLVERGESLEFRHDLLREAVYDEVPAVARLAMHRAAASAILARGGEPSEAAAHLIDTAEPGDQEAVAILMAAAGSAAAHAPRIAADLAAKATELMPSDQPGWTDMVVGTVQLLAWASRFPEADALAMRTLALRLPAESEARLRIGLLDSLLLSARRIELVERCRDALEWTELPPQFRCAFLHNLGQGLAQLGEIEAAGQAYQNAIAVATVEDAELEYSCRIGLSLVEGSRGQMLDALELIEACVKQAEMGTAAEQRRMPWLWYSCALLACDRHDEADDALRTARRYAEELGASWAEEFTQRILTQIRLTQGRIDEAVAEAEASLDLIDTLEMWFDSDTAFGVLTIAAIHRNDFEAARAHLGRSEPYRSTYSHNPVQTLSLADALLSDALGDRARVQTMLSEMVDQPEALMQSLTIEPTQGPQLVRLALRVGDRTRARTVVTALARIADGNLAAPLYRACHLHADGLFEDDIAVLAEGAERFRQSSRHLARGSAFEDAGRGALAHGDHDRGVDLLVISLAAYEHAGASRDEIRVRARLREVGVHRRPRAFGAAQRPVSGWDSLTVAEGRVARLAAEGRTNKQIAEALYLSPYTVATHLKHVFTKLEISSRVELARRAQSGS